MAWLRRKAGATAEIREASERFRQALVRIDEARASLLLGVPSGRAPLLPLAEALAAFEAGLLQAEDRMQAWRRPVVEAEWEACRKALREAAGRAGRLRLMDSPAGYEQLAPVLDELLDPLGAFEVAAGRFKDLGA